MKRLSFLRHAKSSWDQSELEDFNRPLNERGWKSARRMGRELKRRGKHFDLLLASPAARVRETIDGLTETLKPNVEIRFEPRMYLATPQTLLTIVRALAEEVHSPLLVGHNPGLQQFLLEMADGPAPLLKRITHKFPTAAFAEVELSAHRWSEVREGSGRIAEMILAKDLD